MKKVIISEDIKAVLDKEKGFLKRSDIRVFWADTGKKTLALHKAKKADLIIAKLDMPDMNGETLCSLIRDNELCDVSIIIVCSGNESDVERCLQCRANAFISSPINIAVLLQEAERLLHIVPRASFRMPIKVKLGVTKKEKFFTGNTENISASGMLFESAATFFEGDTIRCSFSLTDSIDIAAEAEIVRVVKKKRKRDTNYYGIKFIGQSTDAVSAIETFVKKEYDYTVY